METPADITLAALRRDFPGAHDEADEAARWNEAAQLRDGNPGWVVVWLAPSREFRAYRRMPGARRDTILAAPTAGGLANAMTAAIAASPRARGRRRD
jgi:hypothetical protein